MTLGIETASIGTSAAGPTSWRRLLPSAFIAHSPRSTRAPPVTLLSRRWIMNTVVPSALIFTSQISLLSNFSDPFFEASAPTTRTWVASLDTTVCPLALTSILAPQKQPGTYESTSIVPVPSGLTTKILLGVAGSPVPGAMG